MGRPYQVQEAKPLLLPSHPLSLPFDLGVFPSIWDLLTHADLGL